VDADKLQNWVGCTTKVEAAQQLWASAASPTEDFSVEASARLGGLPLSGGFWRKLTQG
jgi:hypothetical protein